MSRRSLELCVIIGLAFATSEMASAGVSRRRVVTSPLTARWFGLFPLSFVLSLNEPGRSIVGREMEVGSTPFNVIPAAGDTWAESGIDIILLSSPTITSFPPDYFQLVSGTLASQTAGLFTDDDPPPRVMDPATGFVITACQSSTPSTFGVRGGILALASAFDTIAPTFNPKGLVDLLGYVHDPTDAVVDGWWWCEAASCTALGSAAPRDGRLYCAWIVLAAGATSGYALLVDMSTPSMPVVADQRTFARGSATTRFVEVNASPGQVSGPQRTMQVRYIRGTLVYP